MGFHLPPNVALALTIAFVLFLFRRDIREKPDVTGALWLPVFWMLLIFSRPLSEWLAIFGLPGFGASTLEEGSPLDAAVYLGLATAGSWVLYRRQTSLSEIIRNNQWLTIFLLYCFVSIVWSDFPLVAFKRWIKILGHPIMALVVITEPDPDEAIKRLMKRCAYIVVPVSILFIKFYPELGRSFDEWSGMAMNNGIAVGKNMLGADCFILGLFFFWYLLDTWPQPKSRARRNELFLIAGFGYMIWWLLRNAHSSTSTISLYIGITLLLLLGARFINRNFIGTYILAAGAMVVLAEMVFGLSEYVAAVMGKDPTLTGRTELWPQLFGFHTNALIGTGFESFWLGDRIRRFFELYRWHANEAHNGYLETYLNLGVIGLFLLIGMFIATFWKSRRELITNFEFGRFRLALLVAIIVYNWTEAAFKNVSPTWFVFYLIALDYPMVRLAAGDTPVDAGDSTEDAKVIYAETLDASWQRSLSGLELRSSSRLTRNTRFLFSHDGH
jgi:exopolysaccharide production protein ExoQ